MGAVSLVLNFLDVWETCAVVDMDGKACDCVIAD